MKKQPTPKTKCADCRNVVLDTNNLSYKDLPFMGTCQFQTHKFLINFNTCKYYDNRQN